MMPLLEEHPSMLLFVCWLACVDVALFIRKRYL
jgi:hypothetical protein